MSAFIRYLLYPGFILQRVSKLVKAARTTVMDTGNSLAGKTFTFKVLYYCLVPN